MVNHYYDDSRYIDVIVIMKKLLLLIVIFSFLKISNSNSYSSDPNNFQFLLNNVFEKYQNELTSNNILYNESFVNNILVVCIDEIGGQDNAKKLFDQNQSDRTKELIYNNLGKPFLICVENQIQKKIKKKKETKNQTAKSNSKEKSTSASDDYINYTLFGENLYKSIDTLEVIGEVYYWDRLKTIWDEKKRFKFAKKNNLIVQSKSLGNIYAYNLILSPDTKEPVVLDGITDANGVVKLGSRGFPIIPYYKNHLIIKPKNKNELFDLYLVTYSPVSKKILTIRAKTKKKYYDYALCTNDIKIWNDYLLDKFRQDSKNIITTDYKKINPNVYLGNVDSFDKLPASAQKIKAAGFVLGKFPTVDKYNFTTARISYACANSDFSDYAWIKLADIDVRQKINKDFEILQKRRIENKMKNQGLNKNSNLKGM